jgi:fumarate hydratase class II
MSAYRIEHDVLGEIRVPAEALYGTQTQRAVENFPVSGMRLPAPFIHALGLMKYAAAQVNPEVGSLPATRAEAIAQQVMD